MSDHDKFLAAERHAIEKSIYLASEKANENLSTMGFKIKWINAHSQGFRDAWPASICKNCKKVFTCHDCLKQQCDSFDLN